jgi:hypothetical protein
VAAGEEKVLIAEKPLILAMTSGTSGASAMLLSTKDTNTEFFLQVSQWKCSLLAPMTIFLSYHLLAYLVVKSKLSPIQL